MRMAVLSPAAELGGAERSLLTFLQAAQGKLIEARVLLPREGPLGQALTRLGVPWEVVPMPQALLRLTRQKMNPGWLLKGIYQGLAYVARLRQVLIRLAPEVIYTNGIKSHVVGALLRPWIRGRVIWHVRDFWEGRLVGHLADLGPHRIIANSQATARHLLKYMRKTQKVTVVYNAVDPEEFSPTGPLPPPGPWARFSPRLGLVAVFARWKGHSLFLDAARRVLAAFPQAGFFLVGGAIYDSGGETGYDEELVRLVREKDLQDRVVFTGFQPDIAPWYRALDVVVNASLRPEPFGRTLLEAMTCGRAVVGPAAGGVPEFIRHRRNGLLYAMGNERELTEALLSLLRDPSLRSRLGEAGRETAVAHFTPAAHAAAVVMALSPSAG